MSKAVRDNRPALVTPVKLLALLSLIFAGAMFGFFFAWVCSTMWGLDTTDPNIAIAAMQAMNASVRNWLFAPFFFGTPVLLIFTAVVALKVGERNAAVCFGLASVLYVLGAMLPTVSVHVPLNETLALVEPPLDPAGRRERGGIIPSTGSSGIPFARYFRALSLPWRDGACQALAPFRP